jgi:hypothetical protein
MDRLLNEDETELRGFAGEKEDKHLLSVADALGDEGEDDVEDDEFESEDKLIVFDVEEHARMVVAILKPVSFTMALVVWLVRMIQVITINVK